MGKRDDALKMFITIEGRASSLENCPSCHAHSPGKAEYICEDCFSRRMVCSSCCVKLHTEKPLDNIKVCNNLLLSYLGHYSTKSSEMEWQIFRRCLAT